MPIVISHFSQYRPRQWKGLFYDEKHRVGFVRPSDDGFSSPEEIVTYPISIATDVVCNRRSIDAEEALSGRKVTFVDDMFGSDVLVIMAAISVGRKAMSVLDP